MSKTEMTVIHCERPSTYHFVLGWWNQAMAGQTLNQSPREVLDYVIERGSLQREYPMYKIEVVSVGTTTSTLE